MQRASTQAASSNRVATARSHGSDGREAEGGGGGLLRALRSHPWLFGLALLAVGSALVGSAVWRAVADEVGSGPNVFMLSNGSSDPGHIHYSYRNFAGLVREETALEQGQTLELTYEAEVTKGSLAMEVVSPAGAEVWRVNLPKGRQTDGSVSAEVAVPETGSYQVVVTGLDAGGSFDLSWKVR